MFFNSKINYKTKIVVPNYPAVCVVYDWQKDVPATDGVDSALISYIKPKWKYVSTKRNFQAEINSQYCITPKIIATTNTAIPNPQPVQYQKVPLSNLNATDIRQGSKQIVNAFIQKESNQYASKVIDRIKSDDKDLKIKQLQSEIETLKKGVK